MEAAGLVLMLASWGAISALALFCLSKVLRGP